MRYTRRRTLAAIAGIRAHYGPARRDDSGAATGDPNPGGGGTNPGADGKTGQDGDGTKVPQIKGEFDPERMTRDLGKARDDAAKEKAARQAAEKSKQDTIDAIAVALGLKPDPKSDPAALAAQAAKELTDTRAELAEARKENAILKHAGKAGADVDALLDSTRFRKSLDDLDATAKDYDAQVAAAIRDAVKANPKLAAAPTGQGPGKQGADHGGAGGQKPKPKNLTDAITARLGG